MYTLRETEKQYIGQKQAVTGSAPAHDGAGAGLETALLMFLII